MIQGIILGFLLGLAIGLLAQRKENKDESKIKLTLKESIFIAENLIYSEPFISITEANALKLVCEYARQQMELDDDLK